MINLIHRLFVDKAQIEQVDEFALLNEMSPRAELSEQGDISETHEHKSILCRETIVNRDEKVVGHEFMLKKSITRRVYQGHAMRRLYDQALVNQLVGMPLARLLGERFALINFEASHIFDPNLAALPLDQCALLLRFGEEDVGQDVCDQVVMLRQQGLRFGLLAHECLNVGMDHLAENMDFAVLDLQQEWVFSPDVARWLDERDHLQLLACHIDSSEAFASVWHSTVYGERVAYFQGSFISARGDWRLPQAQVLRSHVVYLLECIEREVGTQQLAEALKSDPVIFYKLLRMLNSPALALDSHISSAEQIIKTLGRDSLYRWLSLLLLSAETQAPDDLHFMDAALLRARLMENLGREQLGVESAAQLFMTGALSLIDALMQQTLADALKALALPVGVRQALLERNGPYYPYLQLALAVEQQKLPQVKALASRLGLSEAQVYRCRSEALQWAEMIQH